MEIQSANIYAANTYLTISLHPKQTPADVTAKLPASGETNSDTVAISKTARNSLADPSHSATTQSEANAVVVRYSHLFSDNLHYEITALNFTESGLLSLTQDGKPLP